MRKFLLFLVVLAFISDNTYSQYNRSKGKYVLVFKDEFNLPDGSQPDPKVWGCSRRGWSTWNRWISDSRDVAYIKRGKLVCRAIPNLTHPADTAAMLTGAVETQDRFSFQYGKIEVRLKTKCHPGNFPAVWLMPQPPAPDHPFGGEIDIFEAFDTRKQACHTVHSNWTLNLKGKDQENAKFIDMDIEKWHVYGFEWTPDMLIWSIDGITTGVYRKSSNADILKNGQWPFDRPYYIILNQSVTVEGPWSSAPDLKHIYETQFDWVRVYQWVTN